MALAKQLELDGTGVAVGYWRIHRVSMTFPATVADGGALMPEIEVLLQGFVSKEAREAGRLPVFSATVQLDPSEVGSSLDVMRSLAYAAVKATERFAGADDV